MPFTQDISKRVREFREGRGMTQARLAEALGMQTYQIADVERGKVMPSAFLIRSLVDVLGADPRWLLTGQPEGAGVLAAATTTPDGGPWADVVEEDLVRYLCSACRAVLRKDEERCPECGRALIWPATGEERRK